MSEPLELVGLVPAAGLATRLPQLTCSKEMVPVQSLESSKEKEGIPKPVSQYLLEKMAFAGVSRAFIILRKGKWDIPTYYGDGQMCNLQLAYLVTQIPYGVPYTLDQAFTFVQNARVVMGFPDILFQPVEAFKRILEHQESSHADIVLGVFPVRKDQKADMVVLDEKGRVREIVIKPLRTKLKYAWIIAVWTPSFTRFMHDYLKTHLEEIEKKGCENREENPPELFIGDVVQKAIDEGLIVEGVKFPEHGFQDIGSPEGLRQAANRSA